MISFRLSYWPLVSEALTSGELRNGHSARRETNLELCFVNGDGEESIEIGAWPSDSCKGLSSLLPSPNQ